MTRQEQIQTFVSSFSPPPAGQVNNLYQRGKSILCIADHVPLTRQSRRATRPPCKCLFPSVSAQPVHNSADPINWANNHSSPLWWGKWDSWKEDQPFQRVDQWIDR